MRVAWGQEPEPDTQAAARVVTAEPTYSQVTWNRSKLRQDQVAQQQAHAKDTKENK